jgi:hypothetical protein
MKTAPPELTSKHLSATLPNMPAAQGPRKDTCANEGRALCGGSARRTDPLVAALRREQGRRRIADRNFWLVAAGSAGASLLATAAGIHCRHRNGVEPCTAHYGAFAATEAVRFGFSAIVFPAIGYAWKRSEEGSRHSEWWVLPGAVAAYNVGYAIREFNQGCNGARLPNGGRCQ